jgi:phosphoserine phosphatase
MKLVIELEDLNKIASKLGARFNPNNYFICFDVKGNAVFVPVRTSRHTHTIVVRVTDKADKLKEWAAKNGFDVIEDCLALPDSS